jgi:riboflavin kinase/FMN adenylyltransferase
MMRIYENIEEIAPGEARAVAIGLFDGLHLGHRAVITRTIAAGLIPTVLTFALPPELSAGRILTRESFEGVLRGMGVHTLIRLPFGDVRDLSGEQFAREILVGALCAKAVFCGENFRFGKGAVCDAWELCALGKTYGFTAEALPLVQYDGAPISSTRIRSCIENGDHKAAAAMLSE